MAYVSISQTHYGFKVRLMSSTGEQKTQKEFPTLGAARKHATSISRKYKPNAKIFENM